MLDRQQQYNLIFWGAGATAALGIRTTAEQAEFVRQLAGAGKETTKSLESRVADALINRLNDTTTWQPALCDLLAILGDAEKCFTRLDHIDDSALKAMRRNWSLKPNEDDDQLRNQIIGLRLRYDWSALKAVVQICPASGTNAFRLNDLFNIIDMHLNFGVRSAGDGDADPTFLDSRRLVGARNALNLILIALFHIDYRACLASGNNLLHNYYEFAVQIGRRMQRQGLQLLNDGCQLDAPEFYQGDLGFVSLNYDPIGLWVQFIANREINQNQTPHIGSPAVPLNIYHDFGHLIPARGIERQKKQFPWYPLNEAAAQRLNEAQYTSGYRVRLTKFLFPHGCLCWRECPDCGKLSAYHGHTWALPSRSLFPPPPLRAFDLSPCPPGIGDEEQKRREMGMVDARACLHCRTITYAHHTQIVPQSSFKTHPPSFLDEIQRELRATTMRADHILLMGYSLPPDDVEYRAFFSARRQRKTDVHCTIVNKDNNNPGWHGPHRLEALIRSNNETIKAAMDIFGKENVRFYGGGIPDVFLDESGQATMRKLEELLDWRSTG